jgi:hypothetical protein
MEFGDFEIPDCDCVNDGRDDVRPVDMTDEEFEISFAEATAGPDDTAMMRKRWRLRGVARMRIISSMTTAVTNRPT